VEEEHQGVFERKKGNPFRWSYCPLVPAKIVLVKPKENIRSCHQGLPSPLLFGQSKKLVWNGTKHHGSSGKNNKSWFSPAYSLGGKKMPTSLSNPALKIFWAEGKVLKLRKMSYPRYRFIFRLGLNVNKRKCITSPSSTTWFPSFHRKPTRFPASCFWFIFLINQVFLMTILTW